MVSPSPDAPHSSSSDSGSSARGAAALSQEPVTPRFEPYPDKPLEVFKVDMEVRPGVHTLPDSTFLAWQVNGEKFFLHVTTRADRPLSAEVIEIDRRSRCMNEADKVRLRTEVLRCLENDPDPLLLEVLQECSGFREFLTIPDPRVR